MDIEDIVTGVFLSVAGVVLVFGLAVGFVYFPVIAVTEADCLAKGYPRATVTWNLNRYCINLEGAVTVRVEAQ